ncbi:hypothetical protein RHSIM_Rhsim03G0101900 [Rhododendron simsii]|uniref:Uncharacterized protein n=1 Tax=Rhododendron simsii TaxID=118357 RepID=A0A834H644_RHOSS|nr:hypothetical protein RHSIM_Rhsim03G0101900 [Rhododendron simsii]
MESETATVGRFTVTPVLRSSVVEPRSGDGRIGASEPVPFAEGDFLESANPRDILGVLGVDSPNVQAVATLLRVILSRDEGSTFGAREGEEIPEEMPESETVVEERVTAVDEARACTGETHPPFLSETYSPRLHCFEPIGITNYAPVNADYSGDMLLRDRDRHISTSWTTVQSI